MGARYTPLVTISQSAIDLGSWLISRPTDLEASLRFLATMANFKTSAIQGRDVRNKICQRQISGLLASAHTLAHCAPECVIAISCSTECRNDVLGEQFDLAHLLVHRHETLIEEPTEPFKLALAADLVKRGDLGLYLIDCSG